jgi:hypothetical protein
VTSILGSQVIPMEASDNVTNPLVSVSVHRDESANAQALSSQPIKDSLTNSRSLSNGSSLRLL